MTEILVPMDGNPPSETAFEYALAEFPDAHITVLHVIGVVDSAVEGQQSSGDLRERFDRARASADELFERIRDRATTDDTDVTTETAFGPPSNTIPEFADGFDRIVMGEHGQAGARQILLGSVAETVVRRAPIPVTVVRGRTSTERDRRFLVPIDGSPLSDRALEFVLDEHAPEEITLLYVIDPSEPERAVATNGDVRSKPEYGTEEWYERAESVAETSLEAARKSATGREVSVTAETATGDPSRKIVEYLESDEFDHVVLGSHGRTNLDRLLLGSVAETVVRRSPVTVTVVR